MQLSSKQQIVEAGRKAVEKARKAVGNINAHEADFRAKRKDKNKNIDDIDE
jgi:nucleoside diphosphate kinase